MPVNVVKTPEDEVAWERAKARAHEQYPNLTGERFYRVVMAIYKKMAHHGEYSSPHGAREAASRRMRHASAG